MLLQLVGVYTLIRVFGKYKTHLLVPLILCINSLTFSFFPTFALISYGFITIKAFDFSLFNVIKEMLYIPLKVEEKFRAKALIDVFIYRGAKVFASLFVLGLQAFFASHLLPVVSWLTTAIFILWMFVVFSIKDCYEQSAQEQSATGTPGDATASPIAELEKKLKEAEQKHVYLYAEFENFKKRALREQQEMIKFGWKNVAANLLEVLDNFERALTFAKPDGDPDLVSGLKMVSQQFKSVLEKQGVTEIQTADQAFNPELHEAVGQIPSEKAAGVIVQEQQKGYTLHGRLLRPSRVLISTGPTNSVH
jgi:molecular chaperone GrpE (heat shock protein)